MCEYCGCQSPAALPTEQWEAVEAVRARVGTRGEQEQPAG